MTGTMNRTEIRRAFWDYVGENKFPTDDEFVFTTVFAINALIDEENGFSNSEIFEFISGTYKIALEEENIYLLNLLNYSFSRGKAYLFNHSSGHPVPCFYNVTYDNFEDRLFKCHALSKYKFDILKLSYDTNSTFSKRFTDFLNTIDFDKLTLDDKLFFIYVMFGTTKFSYIPKNKEHLRSDYI